jgi:hypothetical protein
MTWHMFHRMILWVPLALLLETHLRRQKIHMRLNDEDHVESLVILYSRPIRSRRHRCRQLKLQLNTVVVT